MSEENQKKARIRVVDRRWFTPDGKLREDRAAQRQDTPPPHRGTEARDPSSAGTQSSSTPQAPPEGGPYAARESRETGGGVSWPSAVNFLQLVDFLAQQALLLLQGAQGLPANPDQARLFIDFLGVLEDRTRGNLTPEEARMLSDVLFQLRALYVRLAKK